MNTEKATFRLDAYRFTKASMDFDIPNPSELTISFYPRGEFHEDRACYNLFFDVVVDCKERRTSVVKVSCEASFSFDKVCELKDIPEYFYPNSLAIIFPYIRAFVSTLSVQANMFPIVLPTVNLTGLTGTLKEKTEVI